MKSAMNQTINIEQYQDSFVIHFGGEFKRINAYTLASTLVSFADAVKEANSLINQGFEIEVFVEALGEGWFYWVVLLGSGHVNIL